MEVPEREARALVREEERRAKAREEQEERMIQQQMKALRYRWGLLAIIISSVSVHRYKFENGCAYPLDIGIRKIQYTYDFSIEDCNQRSFKTF